MEETIILSSDEDPNVLRIHNSNRGSDDKVMILSNSDVSLSMSI